MAKILKSIFLVLMTLCISCSQSKKSNENLENDLSEKENQKDYNGYLRVDLDRIMLYSKTMNIYNIDESIYAELIGDTLLVNGNKYNLIEDRKDTLRRHITSYSFDPEYKVFILICVGLADDYYKVEMNNGYKLISIKNSNVKFETLEEFVLSSFPALDKNTPLRKVPNEAASIVDNYNSYYYKSTKLEGDWLFLECDKEFNDCPEEQSNGWVKWRDSSGLILRLAQTY